VLLANVKGKIVNKLENRDISIKPLSFLRKVVRLSASVSKNKNTIHFVTEVDVTNVLKELEILKRDRHHITLTAYLATAFALTVEKHKWMNSFVSYGNQVFLDDIAISILMERIIDEVSVPEPMVINNAEKKSP